MDYNRIYTEFINDRIAKQPVRPQYFERHHIVPKSLGGSDDLSNIIRLTPEDHYFAHLCLAKIHGGAQWSSVLCMTKMLVSKNRASKTSGFVNRKLVAVARIRAAEHKSKQYSGKLTRELKEKHCLKHIDGSVVYGAIVSLAEITGLSITSVYRLVNKQQGMSYSGWYFDFDLMCNSKKSKSINASKSVKSIAGKNKRQIKCNETGVVYQSIAQAEKLTGLQIRNYLYKDRNHVGGYTWSYL